MPDAYSTSYAACIDRYTKHYRNVPLPQCLHARDDVYATLAIHEKEDHRSAYVGKLYAELDAIRARIDAYRSAK